VPLHLLDEAAAEGLLHARHEPAQGLLLGRLRRQNDENPPVYKLITMLVAAIPIILFLKTIFGRSRTMKLAAADFRRQIDYLVWVILLAIGCGIVYSVGKLIYSTWN
jgi:hypothetical protein